MQSPRISIELALSNYNPLLELFSKQGGLNLDVHWLEGCAFLWSEHVAEVYAESEDVTGVQLAPMQQPSFPTSIL